MSADRSLGIHHPGTNLDSLDPRHGLHMALDIGPELIAKRAGGDGEGDLDGHRSSVDLDFPHHSELDDVGAELRVDDAGRVPPGQPRPTVHLAPEDPAGETGVRRDVLTV